MMTGFQEDTAIFAGQTAPAKTPQILWALVYPKGTVPVERYKG